MIGIVLNPASGGGRGRALAERALGLLGSFGLEGRLYESERAGGIAAQAERAAAECGRVIVAGGDGSLNEAAEAFCGGKAELMLLPCGSGNDFARTLRESYGGK